MGQHHLQQVRQGPEGSERPVVGPVEEGRAGVLERSIRVSVGGNKEVREVREVTDELEGRAGIIIIIIIIIIIT